MNILHLTPIYWDNWGYQENILPENQSKMGHKVTVIAPAVSLSSYRKDIDGKKREYVIEGVRIIRLPLKWQIFNRFFWFVGLYDQLCAEKPDIIMIHDLAMLPTFEVLKYKQYFRGCLIYADFHSDYKNSATNFISKYLLHMIIWRFIIRKALPYLERVYYVRPSVKRFISELYGLPDHKIEELKFGADIKQFSVQERHDICATTRNVLRIPDNAFVVCTGGKIDAGKKVDILLSAIQIINNPRIHILIFGEVSKEYDSYFRPLIEKTNNTHYVGWVEGKHVYDYFLSSDIAIFLGGHSVLWEQAIGSGTPTIFNALDGSEYLDVGGNSHYIYSNNISEVVQMLRLLLFNPSILDSMRNVALTKGKETFSFETITTKLLKKWEADLSETKVSCDATGLTTY